MKGKRKNKSFYNNAPSVRQPITASERTPTFDTPIANAPRRNPWSYSRLKENLIYWLIIGLMVSPVVFFTVGPIIYIPCYRTSLKPAEFTVDRRERVVKGSEDSTQAYYLVWSREGDVYCVTDSWSFMTFDASDRYGRLREGSHVKAKVAGWRVPFFSWYRNVVVIDNVEEMHP